MELLDELVEGLGEEVECSLGHSALLFFEPVIITAGFVADEFGVGYAAAHFGGDEVGFYASLFCLAFGDEDDGAPAVEAEWRPELCVVGTEDFAVEFAVAWPGALVEDCAVFPVGEFCFDLLQPGELCGSVCEAAFGSVDEVKAEGAEPGDAEPVELPVDGLLPLFEAFSVFEGVGEAVFEGVVYALVFNKGGGEAAELVEGCGFVVAGADCAGDFDGREFGFGILLVEGFGFGGELVEVLAALDGPVTEFGGKEIAELVDEVG